MRIGIDGRLWNETGVGRYIRNLVYNLAEIDELNEYVLFLSSKDIKDGKWQMANGKWQIVPVDIRWHTVEEQIKFPQILNKENLDLVHFPYFSVPVFYNRPYVVTIHDLILNHFPTGKASTLPMPFYEMKRFGYNAVIRHAVKNAKKIVVPLNFVKNDLVNTLHVPENKITVTNEGFDPSLRVNEVSEAIPKKYFLYVGNAYPHKNLDRLIKAFTEFRKDEKDAELLLVGKDDYFFKLLRFRVEDEKLSGIAFRHDVTDDHLAVFYRNAIALISPSLMEGFGLPVIEAMALSCPVVISDIPSFREVAKDSAIYFDPYSIDDIKEKMRFIYDIDKQEREKNIRKGLDRIKHFSWEKMADETLKVYNAINNH